MDKLNLMNNPIFNERKNELVQINKNKYKYNLI